VRFQAEEMIKEMDRLKREEEERRAEEKATVEARRVAEERSAMKVSEKEEKRAEEEETKTKEAPKKAIPRPPPLPTCWPPQVVDGKNVGGDLGVGAAFGMPGGGGGRGGLLGALMGGRGGGGGPLAFLRRKSGTMFKPAVPKLKQLHWDTLESTEGTLWADNSSKIGMVVPVSPSLPDQLRRPSLTTPSRTLPTCSLPHRRKTPPPRPPRTCPGPSDCLDLGKINRCPPFSHSPLTSRSPQVAVLDGQKSQNMNIMLAKFGNKTKLGDILEVSSLLLPPLTSVGDREPPPLILLTGDPLHHARVHAPGLRRLRRGGGDQGGSNLSRTREAGQGREVPL
jgi:hypothetical protein